MSRDVRCVEQQSGLIRGPQSQRVRRFELHNATGLSVELLAYGASVHAVRLPGRAGERVTVTRGLSNPALYGDNSAYMGAVCGRYAGRIANAQFSLGEKNFKLAANDGVHHLHGGKRGLDARLWDATPFETSASAGVHFDYVSADGEEGYPGQLNCRVTYTLDAQSRLTIDYRALVSGQPTVVNLTNHCYWNLSESTQIHDHQLRVAATEALEFDQNLLPTGERLQIAGTALDFIEPAAMGQQMARLPASAQGFDHCYVVAGTLAAAAAAAASPGPPLVAEVTDPESSRRMSVYSDQPALVFYTGNFLDGSASVGGHDQYAGFCLECQQFPDAPNQPEFPSTVVEPGETYRQTSVYAFDWDY